MKILTFSVDVYERSYLDTLTDAQLYEIALSDSENTFIYDGVRSFTNEVNDDMVDTENNWIYAINID